MKTQIIDNSTFMVGDDDLVFEIGNDIPLTEDEEAILAKIRAIEEEMLIVKQGLVNVCHMADKNYAPGLGDSAHKLSSLGIEHVYLMSRFVNDIQGRLGGILPLEFTGGKIGVSVRERRQEAHGVEDLNYTVTNVKRSIGMNRMEDQRLLAVSLAGDEKANVIIDISENEAHKFQPIEARFGSVAISEFKDVLAAATAHLLKKRFFPGNSLVLAKLGNTSEASKAWVISMNLPQNNPQAARARWDRVKKFAKKIEIDIVAAVYRRPGDAQDEKAVGISVLYGEGEKEFDVVSASKDFKIIMGRPQDSDERIQEDHEWRSTFDAQGGVERYAELLEN